jgi:hypothetical protein
MRVRSKQGKEMGNGLSRVPSISFLQFRLQATHILCFGKNIQENAIGGAKLTTVIFTGEHELEVQRAGVTWDVKTRAAIELERG